MSENKLIRFAIALTSAMIFNAGIANAQVVDVDKKTRERIAGSPGQNNVDPSKIRLVSADPAAYAINFSVISCKSPLNGLVKIEGVIKNIGKSDFAYSKDGKIEVVLFEEVRGTGAQKNVASRKVSRLNAGAEIKIAYTRNWNKSDEFPPKYILTLRYDVPEFSTEPKALQSTDKNKNNNKLEKDGQLINNLKFPCK